MEERLVAASGSPNRDRNQGRRQAVKIDGQEKPERSSSKRSMKMRRRRRSWQASSRSRSRSSSSSSSSSKDQRPRSKMQRATETHAKHGKHDRRKEYHRGQRASQSQSVRRQSVAVAQLCCAVQFKSKLCGVVRCCEVQCGAVRAVQVDDVEPERGRSTADQ